MFARHICSAYSRSKEWQKKEVLEAQPKLFPNFDSVRCDFSLCTRSESRLLYVTGKESKVPPTSRVYAEWYLRLMKHSIALKFINEYMGVNLMQHRHISESTSHAAGTFVTLAQWEAFIKAKIFYLREDRSCTAHGPRQKQNDDTIFAFLPASHDQLLRRVSDFGEGWRAMKISVILRWNSF